METIHEPLSKFYCDTCGMLIENPEDVSIEWLEDVNNVGKIKAKRFRLVHNQASSPKEGIDGCNKLLANSSSCDNTLDGFIEYAYAELIEDNDTVEGARAEFFDLFRRLTLPYYEQARFYARQAYDDIAVDDIKKFGQEDLYDYIKTCLRSDGVEIEDEDEDED